MFFNSITSVSRVHPSTQATVVTGSNFYYTFDTVDYNSLTHKNQETDLYDLTIQSNGMKDATTKITGTDDLFMPGTSGNYATITSVSTGTTGITISIWFRSNNTLNGTRIFDLGNGAANNNIEIYLDNTTDKPVFSIYIGATQYTYTATNFIDVAMRTDNTHRNIGIVMNPNGTFKYYLNGGLHRTTTGNQYPNAIARTTNYIGLGSNALTTYLNGGIGEFRMYNTMKTDADMLAYYKSNTRIDNYANMFCHYKFLSADLIQNGTAPKIYNHATGIYDMSFSRTTLSVNVTSVAGGLGLASENSKFGDNYMYSYNNISTTDTTYGCNLPAITTPLATGITVCFWFKIILTQLQWGFLFMMNPVPLDGTTRIGVANNTHTAGNPLAIVKNGNTVSSFPSATTGAAVLGTSWHFYYIRTDTANNTVEHCLDMTTVLSASAQTTNNILFNYVRILCSTGNMDATYAQMDDFRFYKIPLTDNELRAIYTKTNKL
jgi:hypothetical protein